MPPSVRYLKNNPSPVPGLLRWGPAPLRSSPRERSKDSMDMGESVGRGSSTENLAWAITLFPNHARRGDDDLPCVRRGAVRSSGEDVRAFPRARWAHVRDSNRTA